MNRSKMNDALRLELEARLSAHRFSHTLGVEKEMRALASIYLPDRVEEAASAGLLHDITKEFTREEHLSYADKNGIYIEAEERENPALLHSRTGAYYAEEHYPLLITEDVFSAILRHTTADANMSVMDTLLYLADFMEEGRGYESCQRLRSFFYTKLSEHKLSPELLLLDTLIFALDLSFAVFERENRNISDRSRRPQEWAVARRDEHIGKK